MTTLDATRTNPARFGPEILVVIQEMIGDRLPLGARILDPFAGSGRVHDLRPWFKTYGVELEPEWVEQGPTAIGDSRQLARILRLNRFPKRYMGIVTSPCFGNRMADHHNAKEKCKACKGSGLVVNIDWADDSGDLEVTCTRCGGSGANSYVRKTYKHQLGRDLTQGNAGEMQWHEGPRGDPYRALHLGVWINAYEVLDEGGCFLLDISDHLATVGPKGDRHQERQLVTAWHVETLSSLGLTLVEARMVGTPRMMFGQNREARTEGHLLALFEKPVIRG